MDTAKVKMLLAAIECGSLSRAAQSFSYTPSAFSHMLASFEQSLGVRILERSAKGVTLTPEGEILLPKFKRLLATQEDITHTVSGLLREKQQELCIAAYPSISKSLLSVLLRDFKASCPEIKLSIRVGDDMTGWLEQGRADVVFADDSVFEKNEWHPMLTDRYLAIAPRGLLQNRTSICADELYAHPHLFTDDVYLNRVFDRERFKELIYFKSEDDLAVIRMVRAGMGIAILPALVLDGNTEGVDVLELEEPIHRVLGFAYKNEGASRAVKRFVKHLRKNM